MRPRFNALTIADIRRETADCISVAFRIPEDLKEAYRFVQGQYLTLRADINGEDLRRSYSICSGVNDGELRVAIKKVEGGAFSSWANDHLKVGMEMQVMTPVGNFTSPLDPAAHRHYLLVAAGSGITPIMSIARSVLDVEPGSEVTLVYGNRHFNSIIFREELENMKDVYLGRFRLFHVLSGEPNEIPLFHGRIDGQRMEEFCSTFIDLTPSTQVFVCGPEPMIRAVRDFASERGVPAEQIHFELFVTPDATPAAARPKPAVAEKKAATRASVSVIFDGQRSDFEMEADGTSVLDAARNHGMDIPFSCKGGMCCTCRAHLDEGSVDMKLNYALEPGEVEAGFILTCQAVPTSGKIVVDFDRS